MTAEAASRRAPPAPGPRGWPGLGSLLDYQRDRLAFLTRARERYGDLVRFRLGGHTVFLVNHPDDIQVVLRERAKNYVKATNLGAIFGQGIFTSDGELWRRQRRLMQPMFHLGQLERLVSLASEVAREWAARWRDRGMLRGPFDVEDEMTGLAFEVVGRSLFGANLSAQFRALNGAMNTVNAYLVRRFYSLARRPDWMPSAERRGFAAALRTIDGVIFGIIEAHRQAPATEGKNLVSLLLAARDPETGQGMDERQIRDELVTLLLAGHETTAHALGWTLELLARHPEILRELRRQIRAGIPAGTEFSTEVLERLPLLSQVIEESLRLYPIGWAWSRRALADDVIRGYRVPAGAVMLISPYVTHRDPAFWPDPERFDPGRFAPARAEAIPKGNYFPFGGGARQCIGRSFALLEMAVVLGTLVRDFDFAPVPGRQVVADAKTTIGTKDGIWLRVSEA